MDKALKYILLIAFLSCAAFGQILAPIFVKHPSAGISWTPSQVACSGQTGCPSAAIAQSGPSATATFSSSLTANDTVVIGVIDTGATPPSSVVVGSATVVGPVAGCQKTNATVGLELNCYYVLSALGGETTAVVTFASAPATWAFTVGVAHKTGGAAVFDNANAESLTSPCSSCTGTTVPLTGSNDFIYRLLEEQSGQASAVSGGYTFINPLSTDATNIGAEITGASSGAGPTYTITISGQFLEGAIAIK